MHTVVPMAFAFHEPAELLAAAGTAASTGLRVGTWVGLAGTYTW
jgi:hypothetical protein